jgi:steroid delta-isomerase-like uncharacterized protein
MRRTESDRNAEAALGSRRSADRRNGVNPAGYSGGCVTIENDRKEETVAQSPVDVARAWVGLFGAGDVDALRSLYAEDARLSVPGEAGYTEGADAIADAIREWKRAFPDLRGTVNHVHADGSTVTMEATFAGTWDGPLQILDGRTLTPTHRPMSVRICEVMEIEDGRIRVVRGYFDMLTILQQVGALEDAGVPN